MNEEANVSNIKRLQEKALLWRMWIIGLSFVIPAISIGTSMAYSVVGYEFYMKQRNIDGTNVVATEDTMMRGVNNDTQSIQDASSTDGDVAFSPDEGSWFVSVLSLTIMIGTLLSGSVIENVGCLWTLRLGMMIELGGWIFIIAGQFSFTPVFVGRILSGFGCGLTLPAAYMLLSDVSLVRYRGIFAVLNSSSCNVGFLIGLIVGAWCSFPVILVSCVSASVSFLIISIFLPESPLWLIKKGKDDRALKIIQRIRGNNYPAHVEAKEIFACVNTQKSDGPFIKKIVEYGLSRPFLQPLAIMLVIATIQGLSGVDAISYYCVTIFKMANLSVDAYTMSIFMQMGYTGGYIMIAPFMDSIDRKRLFIVAGFLMTTSLVILGATISPDEDSIITNTANATVYQNKTSSNILPEVVSIGDFEGNINEISMNMPPMIPSPAPAVTNDEDNADWFHVLIQMAPCISVVVFTFSYGAGFGPAIYTWTSEVFPSNLKGVGSSIALASRNIVVFIVLKIYPSMIVDLGLSKVFWMHASVMLVGILFVYFVMPETRGLTLTELNQIFGGKISYGKSNTYDIGSVDTLEELTGKKDMSSLTNTAVAKVAASESYRKLSKVASAAAISRVASLALSLGGRGKDNVDDDDVELLRQQISSEESSDVEFGKIIEKPGNGDSEDTIDGDSDDDSDDGMTMNV